MKKPLYWLAFLILFSAFSANAQTKKASKKPVRKTAPAKRKSTPRTNTSSAYDLGVDEPEPPPMEMMADTAMMAPNSSMQDEPTPPIDTSAVPEDELTQELRLYLKEGRLKEVSLEAMEKELEKTRAANPELKPMIDAFVAKFKTERGQRLFENMVIRVYRQHFDAPEVRQLIAFQRTPIGKKMNSLVTTIMGEVTIQSGILGSYLMQEVMAAQNQ